MREAHLWAWEPRRKVLWSWCGNIVGRQKNSSENPWFVAVWKSGSCSASRHLFKAKTYPHYSLVLSFYQGSFRKSAGNVWANSSIQILLWVKAYIKTISSKRFLPPLTPLMSKAHVNFASISKIFANLTAGISCTTFPVLQRASSPASPMSSVFWQSHFPGPLERTFL